MYIKIVKNLDMLKTGGKPAPGKLVIIQGLVNTFDIEAGIDEIGTKELLKAWLIRHGLLRSDDKVSSADQRTALSLREALRSLLSANNGEKVPPSTLKQLNKLLSKFPLTVTCDKDCNPSLSPYRHGMAGVFGLILSQVILAVNEGTWSRLKACRESNCRWAFYDGSRNRSGRWCAMSVCGSRVKARAYRRRRSVKEQKPGTRQKNSSR